jgi:DNA-binding response OmpR family regulator
MNLLLVEDDERVIQFLERGLRAEGYAVTVARTGTEALEHALHATPDVMTLDLMLPDMDGREVCQRVRAAGKNIPIIMLTALDGLQEVVGGLRMGADDYVTKPFAFDELLARLGAVLRRTQRLTEQAPTKLEVGDLSFDRETLNVRRGARVIELTAKELALLELFMTAPGKVQSRARILSNVWGYTSDPLTNVVDVYVRRLRSKLENEGEAPLIKTIRGFGYKLETPGP